MKTLRTLREEMRAFNLDTDEELDLDDIANLDLDSLLGGEFGDTEETEYTPLDFDDLGNQSLDDYVADDGDIDPDAEIDGDGEFDLDGEGLEGEGDLGSMSLDDYQGDELGDGEAFGDEGLDGEEFAGEENPDFQGEIRTVRGANLVFKRKTEDGNFEELWIFNVGKDIKRETQVRRAVLAGTDIDPGSQESKDGSQRAETTTTGNVQFLHITGLPQ